MLTGQQIDDTPTTKATNVAMGFVTPVAPDTRRVLLPSAVEYAERLAESDREEFITTAVRQAALANVDHLNRHIMEFATQPQTSLRSKLDILEQQIKLSGVAARNQAKEAPAQSFSITINIPGQPSQTIGNVIDVTPSGAPALASDE